MVTSSNGEIVEMMRRPLKASTQQGRQQQGLGRMTDWLFLLNERNTELDKLV